MAPERSDISSSDWVTIEDFLDSRYRAANAAEKVDLFLGEVKQHAGQHSLKLDVDLSFKDGTGAGSSTPAH